MLTVMDDGRLAHFRFSDVPVAMHQAQQGYAWTIGKQKVVAAISLPFHLYTESVPNENGRPTQPSY